jgi:hypothetical protein
MFDSRHRRALWSWLSQIACLLLSVSVCGCAPAVKDTPAATAASSASESAASAGVVPAGETWDVILMQGAPLGYVHTVTRQVEHEGQPMLETEATQRMTVQRFGDQAAPGASFKSLETPDGKLVRFESQQQIGPTAQTSRGEVRGGQLVIETSTTGKTQTSSIPWSDAYSGLFALEHGLVRQPLKPGQQRSVQALAPIFNQLATYEFAAKDEEETKLLEGTQRLLRIDVLTRFGNGSTVRSVVWTDAKGEILKTRTEAFSWETYRTTKERALGGSTGGGAPAQMADLGLATIVRLEQPLAGAHQTRRVRYEVSISGDSNAPENDPARIFPNGPRQQVKPIRERTAELIVTSAKPASGPQISPVAPPSDADRQPNNLVQSDHELVVRMADEAAGNETDPRRVAMALERHVKRSVRTKNFTQALATAADVAQTREGDCTEHAVLLAALARAKGIPARVAIGLVYVPSLQGFGYHMWNEVYVEDDWLPLDSTLGEGGIGGAHLKLAHTSLASGDAFTAFLPVAQVLGRLQIKVLEVE